MAKTSIKEWVASPQHILWRLRHTRARLKEANGALGEVRIADRDDIGLLVLELGKVVTGTIALLDKRISKAKEQGK
ncbi:MAG TPA: hypothetical protein VIE66_10325 [Methylocella sp.]|jgi:hypothetical protein